MSSSSSEQSISGGGGGRALVEDHRRNNAAIINQLRKQREEPFRDRNFQIYFGPYPLHAILFPFLDPQLGSTQLGGLLSMEHIQDFAICARQFTARRLTLRLWPNVQLHLRALVESRPNAQGYLHWLEIRFAWFFVKLAGMKDAQITTQQILSIHQAAIEAAEAFNRTGSVKRNGNGSRDHRFISGQQVESFKIKPLLRVLIIIIGKRIDRPFLNALQRM
jgi:hypothetical protein